MRAMGMDIEEEAVKLMITAVDTDGNGNIDFNGQFYSHLIADIEYLDASHELEVRCQLPIQCEQFAHAAVNYYQFALGPQKNTISHNGPKGPSILTHNVIRAEWGVALEASALT